MLGAPKMQTMERWLSSAAHRRPVKIPDAALIRISQIMLIEQRLKKALPDEADQAAWIRSKNKALDGHMPLMLMCHTAQSLARVKSAIEKARYH